ncbi:hypothetical protein Dimus_024407, partial [Dionaea muscipula]
VDDVGVGGRRGGGWETTFGAVEVVVAVGGVRSSVGGRQPWRPVAGELPSSVRLLHKRQGVLGLT